MNNLKISRILHAGYIFELEGVQIAFDTIFENPFSHNCYAFPQVRFDHEQIRALKFDAVFISHHHDDHCSLESLVLLDRSTPLYLYCQQEALFKWIRELGFLQVQAIEIDQAIRIGTLEVVPRRALDADVDSMFQIRAQGLNILNVVDSWIDDETLELLVDEGPWDLILWPFQTMREIEVLSPTRAASPSKNLPPEWISQLKVLKPRYLVPSSCQFLQEEWSWYNQALFPVSYAHFQQQIESKIPQCKVIRLNPGVSICLSAEGFRPAEPLTWLVPVGEQEVDYHYSPAVVPTPTSDIAKKLGPLNPQQRARVLAYCEQDLIEISQSLNSPEDPYFRKPRAWRLQVFGQNGEVSTFFYRITMNGLKKLDRFEGRLEWTTEIPMAKLFAALENGESLTSLYLRVNESVFDPETENEIASADILEDPLIRCLFEGQFGSYQLAQLRRLRRTTELPSRA